MADWASKNRAEDQKALERILRKELEGLDVKTSRAKTWLASKLAAAIMREVKGG